MGNMNSLYLQSSLIDVLQLRPALAVEKQWKHGNVHRFLGHESDLESGVDA